MSPTNGKREYFSEEFDKFFEETIAEYKVLGVSIAIVDEEEIHAKGYGYNGPGGRQTTKDTLFHVASMSKSFTAGAIALLVDDEKYPQVKWTTPVSELLREDFVLSDPYRTQNVTIEDLLCHRVGMYSHEDVWFGWDSKEPSTVKSITRCLRHLPLEKPFRTSYQYTNLTFNVASYLVEKVTGKSFDDVLRGSFWIPLGMMNTYSSGLPSTGTEGVRSKHDDNIAKGCYWSTEKECYVQLADVHIPEAQGAGSIVSSAEDWARWIRAMIQKTELISEKSLAEMIRPRIVATGYSRPFQSPVFYGLGWKIEYYRGYKIVSHAGGLPGLTSYMLWLPERKWGAVILGNTESIWDAIFVVVWTLLDKILEVPLSERTDWAQKQRDRVRTRAEKAAQKAEIYPHEPNPTLPLPLPPSAYTGRYWHPAYRELNIVIKDGYLFADCSDRTFGYLLTFKHFSSDYFVAERQDVPQHASETPTRKLQSAFKIGPSGQVERVGIDLSDGDDSEWIWFERADTGST